MTQDSAEFTCGFTHLHKNRTTMDHMRTTWTTTVLKRPSPSPSEQADSGKGWTLSGPGVFHRDTGTEVHFGKGTKLTVLEQGRKPQKPTVQIFPPSPNECRNKRDQMRKKTLVCVASGFYPEHVTVFWKVNGKNKTDSVATDANAQLKDRFYSISSRLRVMHGEWSDPQRTFTCSASFFDGEKYIDTSVTINGAKSNSTDTDSLTREYYLKTTNAARLSYGVIIIKSIVYGVFVVFVVWKLQGSGGKGS